MATAAAPDTPRITYHAPGRTFDRLFKEASLAETKDVVRAKLRLAPGAGVALTQLRDGQRIDLEDDGDFEALKALASAVGHVVVLVSVDGQTWPGLDGMRPVEGGTGVSNALALSKKARRRARSVAPPAGPLAASASASALTPAPVSEADESGPKRKKRKVAFDSAAAEPAIFDASERRKRKDKAKAGPSSQPDIPPDSTSREIMMPRTTESQPPQPGPSRSRSATRESELPLESDKKAKKHKKKKSQSDVEATPASPAISMTEEIIVPPTFRPSPTLIHPPASRARAPSPERKRKRKRHTSPSPSETPAPATEAQSLEPPKKKKMKNKHKVDMDVPSAPVRPSSKKVVHAEGEESVQAPAVAESVETPAKKKKKTKPKADVDVLSAPLPLSPQKDAPAETDESVQLAGPESIETPAKKKRKNKRAQDAGAPSASASPPPQDARARGEEALKALAALVAAPESIEPPAKKKKKSRHTEVGPASIPLSPSPERDAHTEVEEPSKALADLGISEPQEDSERKVKRKKSKARLEASPEQDTEVEEPSGALADSGISEPQEGSGGKVKRKKSKARLDASPEQDLVPPTASAGPESITDVATAEKKLKKRKSKASLPEPAADADEVPITDTTEPKRGRPKSRPRWAEVSAMHVERPMSISAPLNASLDSKRERRKSKLPMTEQSFSASAPQGAKLSKENPVDNFESSSAGHPKAKKGKKSQGPVDPSRLQALEADLQAAFDLVVHGKTAAASPPAPKPAEAPSQPKPAESPSQTKPAQSSSQPAPPPVRKRLSKSRLNVSWGPADFAKGVSPELEEPDSEGEEVVPVVDKSVDVGEKPVEEAEVEKSEDEEEVEAGEADKKLVEDAEEGKEDAEEGKEDAEEGKEDAEEEKEDAEEEIEVGDTGKAQVSASTPSAAVISPSISRIDTSAMEGIQRLSTPTFPAGTMISEVTIESRDEGSSNEDSDSESDDEENEAEHTVSGTEEEEELAPALTPVSKQSEGLSSAPPPPSSYDDQLEALIRGPRRPGPRRSVLDELPSESTTEDESDKESPPPAMEEEEEEDEAKERSKSFRRARSASSSDTELETEAEVDEPPIFMDGSQEVPPVEPPPPAFMEDALHEPEEVDEKEPSFEVEDNVPEPPADNDAPSDRASEHSTSNAQTAVDGHTSDKAALLSPVLAPTAVGPECELQEETQRRFVSPDSEATVKGGEDREAQGTKEPETSDQSASRDVDTGANDAAIPESEPTSPVVDHEAEEEQLVVKPIQAEGSASQASSIADEEGQHPSTADNTATQEPSTAGNHDEIESIEPADDLEERRRRAPEPDDDPIEFDLTQRAGAAMRTPSPAAASSRPGTIQRMKDRNGKRVSLGVGLPVLASQTSETANNATNVPARRSGRLASRPSGSQTSSHEAAPTPAPAPAPAPKRRGGRQPLSEEEKAARAAARQAEKDAKAAQKQAEKEEKARTREKKEREKKEKKGAKAAKKPASKASTARKAPASKRAATLPPPLEPEPEQTAPAAPPASAPQPASPTPSQEATQQSVVAWATLPSESPAPGHEPSQVSAFDQLRSSSPAADETIIAAKAPSSILVPDPSQPVHESSDDFPYENTPLFLPGSSQYPITQSAVKLSSSPRARAASENSDSDDETPLPQKKRAPTQQRGHPFRRLTDIASQSSLFLSPGVVTSTPYALRPPPGQKRIDHRLRVDDDDDDDDDDSSGSDSDAPPKSHIPKNRRAGAGRKSGRPSGLRSLTQ